MLGRAGARALRELHVAVGGVDLRLGVDVERVAAQVRRPVAAVSLVADLGRVAAVVHGHVSAQRQGAALGVALRAVAVGFGAGAQNVALPGIVKSPLFWL